MSKAMQWVGHIKLNDWQLFALKFLLLSRYKKKTVIKWTIFNGDNSIKFNCI